MFGFRLYTFTKYTIFFLVKITKSWTTVNALTKKYCFLGILQIIPTRLYFVISLNMPTMVMKELITYLKIIRLQTPERRWRWKLSKQLFCNLSRARDFTNILTVFSIKILAVWSSILLNKIEFLHYHNMRHLIKSIVMWVLF